MRERYIEQYKTDQYLRASCDLLKNFIFQKAWRTDHAQFSLIFLRLTDRVLYHSANVWLQFEADLRGHVEVLEQLGDDGRLHTGDISSKYEIEAYLGAATTLFEPNLIGTKKQNLLGRCFAQHDGMVQCLRELFYAHKGEFTVAVGKLRNHSYHANAELRDAGFYALVKKQEQSFVVTLPNIYVDEKGRDVDLAEVFVRAHIVLTKLLQGVRDTLLGFLVTQYGGPENNTFKPIPTSFGNMMVGIGPNGFEFHDYTSGENP